MKLDYSEELKSVLDEGVSLAAELGINVGEDSFMIVQPYNET